MFEMWEGKRPYFCLPRWALFASISWNTSPVCLRCHHAHASPHMHTEHNRARCTFVSPNPATLAGGPHVPPIPRHSNSRPDRAGVTPTRRTHRTDSHARMHSTHAHQQPHTNTNIHTDIHARTHSHTNTNTHSHTHTHTRKPIHTHPSKMILLQSRCPVLTRSPRLRVYTVCEISTRATWHRKRPRAS